MRVKVVRTPGELRDEIGHRVIVRKGWEGTVEEELTGEQIAAAGFHPKQQQRFFAVRFDDWAQVISLSAAYLVITEDDEEE